MTSTKSAEAVSPLRRRMIEDMSVRKFGDKTRHDYIRHVESFAKFLGRSPDSATGEDLRRYQVPSDRERRSPAGNERLSGRIALLFQDHAWSGRPRNSARARALPAPAAAGVEPRGCRSIA